MKRTRKYNTQNDHLRSWRVRCQATTSQQFDEVALKSLAHDEVDDGVLRAVRVSEQQRQWRQPRHPAGRRLDAAAAAAAVSGRHSREVEVEIDDVVRQPRAGEESSDQQQHDGRSSPPGKSSPVAAAWVAVAPEQGGVVTAGEERAAGSDVRRDDDDARDDVDEDAQCNVEGLPRALRRPLLVAEVEPFATAQLVAEQRSHCRQRRHDDAGHDPRGAQCRCYDDARRREIARFHRMSYGDVSVDAQQHYCQNAGSDRHSYTRRM